MVHRVQYIAINLNPPYFYLIFPPPSLPPSLLPSLSSQIVAPSSWYSPTSRTSASSASMSPRQTSSRQPRRPRTLPNLTSLHSFRASSRATRGGSRRIRSSRTTFESTVATFFRRPSARAGSRTSGCSRCAGSV